MKRTAVMEPATGVVNYVSFSPGRTDGLIDVQLDLPGEPKTYMVLASEDGAELTADGKAVALPELLAWLAGRRARATVYPLPERYGAATKAEFVSENRP